MRKVFVLFVLAFGLVPAASASADPPAGEAGEPQTYKVQRGDRLPEVARSFGLTQEEILAANPRTAYGVACGNPYNVPLADGQNRAICGRPRFYLIAGKTLVIPESRVMARTENISLSAELAAVRAEKEELQQKYETEKSELAAIAEERDSLRDENKSLIAAKAEIKGERDELQADFQAALARGPRQVEVQKTNYIHIALAVSVTAFFAVLVIIATLRKKGEHEKKFENLVLRVQPSLSDQAEANKRRGAELDKQAKEAEKRQREQSDLQTQLQTQKGEQERQGQDFVTREQALKTGQTELAAAQRVVADREANCARREGENKAADERLKTGRETINRDWETLHEAERRLATRGAEVDAKLRTAAEDLPKLEQAKGEVTERISTVTGREIDAKRREEEAAAREAAAKQREEAAARREEELRRRGTAVEDAERVLASRISDVEGREGVCDTREGAFRAWEERLTDRERKIFLAELPGSNVPHRPTLQPAAEGLPAPPPPIGGAHDDPGGVDDDNPTVAFPPPPGEDADPRAITGIEIAPGPTHEVGSVDIVGERPLEPSREPAAASKDATPAPTGASSELPQTADGTGPHETGPQIPIADKPSHEESGFYCSVHHRTYSAEEYARDHAAHDEGLPKPPE